MGFRMAAGRARERGFTLLELLVVVFILSSLAMLTSSFVESSDEQLRFADTRTRLLRVREGVVGPDRALLDSQPTIGGFVADVGRLPADLTELLERGALPPWHFEARAGLWAGWRGPYVEPQLERDANGSALRTYRDGWRNRGGPPLFGWKLFRVDRRAGTLALQSFGADGRAGGSGYAADQPVDPVIVKPGDHIVDLRGLAVEVTLDNRSAEPLELRLMVMFPKDGSFAWSTAWPQSASERDQAGHLSGRRSFPAQATTARTFTFTVEVGGAPVPKPVPWGLRSIIPVMETTGEALPGIRPVTLPLHPRAALPHVPTRAWTWP